MFIDRSFFDMAGLASHTVVTRDKWANWGRNINGDVPVVYDNDIDPWNIFSMYVR